MTRKKDAGVRWLKGPRDIRSLRRTGRFSRGSFVFVWATPVPDEGREDPVVGVVTGRGFGKAVERNLAKRRVRGCIMDRRHLLERGVAYLVECRPGAQGADYQILVNEIGAILAGYSSCMNKKSGTGGGR